MVQMAQFVKGHCEYGDYTPAADVTAGDVVVDGDSLLICTGGVKTNGGGVGISATRMGAMVIRGGFFLVKADGAIGKRKRIFWDATAKKITLTSAGNLQFGFLGNVAAAADGDMVPAYFQPAMNSKRTATVAAAGSTQADAVQLLEGFNLVTGADGTKGGLLPVPYDGMEVIVVNSDAANAILKVYPTTGKAINAIAANGAISMAAKSSAIFKYLASTGTWYTIPKVPS